MAKAYTTKGDEGFTRDFLGKTYLKDDLIIVTNGKMDSLQSALDMALFLDSKHSDFLKMVQKKLWQTCGEIANCPIGSLNAPITDLDLKQLEEYIDSLGEPPNKFVRFNNETSIWFNECRVRCRELELSLVKMFRDGKVRSEVYRYINRLSSLFFMLGYTSS